MTRYGSLCSDTHTHTHSLTTGLICFVDPDSGTFMYFIQRKNNSLVFISFSQIHIPQSGGGIHPSYSQGTVFPSRPILNHQKSILIENNVKSIKIITKLFKKNAKSLKSVNKWYITYLQFCTSTLYGLFLPPKRKKSLKHIYKNKQRVRTVMWYFCKGYLRPEPSCS